VLALPDDPLALKGVIAENLRLLADKDQVISELEERIRLFQAMLFAPKSEKRAVPDPAAQQQHSLFDEAEATVEISPEAQGIVQIPAHARAKRGRRPLPAALPRVEVIHDLSEAEKICACGSALTRIGEEVSEKLDIIPAKIQVLRHIRIKYACRSCEGVESDGGAVKLAPMPPQIIPQGIVTPGLLADLLIAKFADGLPFYRQESKFSRMGIELSRATMCNWALLVGRAVEPLMELLLEEIRSGPILGLDETPVQVLREPGRANTTDSYMWLIRGGPPDTPGVYFHYAPTRAGSVARDLVDDFKGWVQTDGYAGYDELAKKPGVRLQGCMAHMRRNFVDVIKAAGRKKPKPDGGLADTVLAKIAQLYVIESQARELKLDPERIKALRQVKAGPILEEIKKLLDDHAGTTPPKSLLGKAIAYARKQWSRIIVYLEDGRLRPDNNLVENAIRPFAVGRKNWLFSGSPRGARASAAIYSLIETAKANNLEPYDYLRFLFERLPYAAGTDELRALLPQGRLKDILA
jgi:transposase